ncbi:hypothetical protein [Streptomyces mirabilis]
MKSAYAVSEPKMSPASAVPGTSAVFWLSVERLAPDTPLWVP